MPKNRLSRLLFLAVNVVALVVIGRNLYRIYPRHSDPNQEINTALWKAIGSSDVSAVRLLLGKGADPNATTTFGTPLETAIIYASGQAEFRFLPFLEAEFIGLPHKTPGDKKPNPVETTLESERMRVRREIVGLLQSRGARMMLRLAAMNNNIAAMRTMLDAGANVNEVGHTLFEHTTALQEATWRGHWEETRLLIERGANLNVAGEGKLNGSQGYNTDSGNTPLICAILARQPGIVHLMLLHGADPNLLPGSSNDVPALALAISILPEVVPELLAKGANVNLGNGVVLNAAIRRHNIPLLKELLGRGANVNPLFPTGYDVKAYAPDSKVGDYMPKAFLLIPVSPLMNAVCFAPECETILLHAGAKIGSDKSSILPGAVLSERIALLPHLLALGADINGSSKSGETALNQAILHAPAHVRFLLEHGADPNRISRVSFLPPLSLAAISGATECARLLLTYHANVNLHPVQGHTPLYYARKHNHAAIAALLRQAGGKEE